MRLENKVALISGGARGMGAVEAKLFANEGARVVIGDVLEDEGRRTEAEINESGGECVFVRLDVTSEESWQSAVSQAVDRFGKLDILVNNAGIYRTHNVTETTGEEWDQVMDINAKGVFLGTKAAIPAMRDSGGGSIVNISSVAGLVGNLMSSAYTASKGAVRLFTKSTAIQYARDGIRCNSVHPGLLPGGPHQPDAHRQAGDGRGCGLRRAVPGLGRGVVHDRVGAGDRRREDGRVIEAAQTRIRTPSPRRQVLAGGISPPP